MKTVFIDKPENILVILKLIKQVPTLKRIILTKKLPDDTDLEIRNKAKEFDIDVFSFNQLRVIFFEILLRNAFEFVRFSFQRNSEDRNLLLIM